MFFLPFCYTFIYKGIYNNSFDVIVEMGQQYSAKKFCAIAQLDFGGDNSITVKKLLTFHDGHRDCDRQYGWGFNYSPGSKD